MQIFFFFFYTQTRQLVDCDEMFTESDKKVNLISHLLRFN